MSRWRRDGRVGTGAWPVLAMGLVWAAAPPAAWSQSERLEHSVVWISTVKQTFDYTTPWKQSAMSRGIGSGFVIAGNRILTNAHNISDARYVEVKKQDEARRYPAQVAFVAHDCDLAILAVADASFFDGVEPLTLGGLPSVNTTVSTYGFPVGGQHISVTEGVISRLQMDIYSHPVADSHLVIQTDAAINPGNSGGPVLQDGKVVGVAFQGLRQADNIGFMIPTTVIRHFLQDIEDGRYDAYGSLGFAFYQGLHNRAYKAYLQVPDEEQGIVVLKTVMHSSVETLLQRGDVITHIDGHDIDNDGMILIDGLRLMLSEAIERKQIADKVVLTFYRRGERHVEEGQIALNRPVLEYSRQYDQAPDYVVYAGLTFVSLTRNFLETWGRDWYTAIPPYLKYLFQFATQVNTDRQRQEFVVLSQVLADEVNAYAEDFVNQPVESINGVAIWSLADVAEAVGLSEDGFFRITFLGSDRPLVLDDEMARDRQEMISSKYQIPAAVRIGGRP